MARFHVLSDIHLEFHLNIAKVMNRIKSLFNLSSVLPNTGLILAGDIGYPVNASGRPSTTYKLFLETLRQHYAWVVVVAGNHEYYPCKKTYLHSKGPSTSLTIEAMDDILRTMCESIPGVTFLQKNTIIIDGVRFLGCTGWTRPTHEIWTKMNDSEFLSHSDVLTLHQDHRQWIQRELTNDALPTVVITHHPPCMSVLSDLDHPFVSAYATDETVEWEKVRLWVCGHTHQPAQPLPEKLLLNPLGYISESSCARYVNINLSDG